jgi:hypothetical protein
MLTMRPRRFIAGTRSSLRRWVAPGGEPKIADQELWEEKQNV